MNAPDTPLALPMYERLPEVLRERDAAGSPPGQLRAFVDALDTVFTALRQRVEQQYDDLFIDTCSDWVVPYIADLVGTSHLSGDPQALRADVARTVFHRRRKGTLGAVESQVHVLSGWAVHAIELRNRLAWNMPLNHLRPDAGGASPFTRLPAADPRQPVRGGTAALRAPAWLSFVGGPFDPFARTVDLKPPQERDGNGPARPTPNLPHLGVFVWRLLDLQVPVLTPALPAVPVTTQASGAPFVLRAHLHPLGEPLMLFNSHRYQADSEPPNLASEDAVPNPMPVARLTSGAPAGNPAAYVQVLPYAGAVPDAPADDAPGLVLHVPAALAAGINWHFRGANLCAWEAGLAAPLAVGEVAVDPRTGRIALGLPGPTAADVAEPLAAGLRASVTHGTPGPVGAQPLAHPLPVAAAGAPVPLRRVVRASDGPGALAFALRDLGSLNQPLVVEIADSATYALDVASIPGVGPGGELMLTHELTVRARDGQRPVVRLSQPLRLRPDSLGAPSSPEQADLNVRFVGLYLTRGVGWVAGTALVTQAAVNTLSFDGCTLDPGGATVLDGSALGGRAAPGPALQLAADLGLAGPELDSFDQVPQVNFTRCVTGSLFADDVVALTLTDTIVDAAGADFALTGAAGDNTGWGPDTTFSGVTLLGATRVQRGRGAGAIFAGVLQVQDNQDSHDASAGTTPGCLRQCWFTGLGDRLPPHHGCVFGAGGPGAPEPAALRFVATRFGAPGYAQLAWASDSRLREGGPADDEMGAWGFLLNTHKWKNICIRLREFMPLGLRALIATVT